MAIRFDGSAVGLTRTSNIPNCNSAYSASFWFYLVSVPDTQYRDLITFGHATDNSAEVLEILGGSSHSHFDLYTERNSGELDEASGTKEISTGTWYHIGVVRESVTSLKLYVDGSLDATSTFDMTSRELPTVMAVGCLYYKGSYSQELDGRITGLKIWNTALTQDEIKQEANSVRPIHFSDLYGFYPMFPGSGERTRDYGGSGYDFTERGTLTDEDPPPVSWGSSIYLVNYPSSSVISGTTVWGHITGVIETNVRTFASNWTGTGAVGGSGDTERLELDSTEYMVSEVVNTGIKTVQLLQNTYAAGDTVTLKYRHGADEATCLAAGWNTYSTPFISLGYIQVRVESTL